jgi:hypothetical protein
LYFGEDGINGSVQMNHFILPALKEKNENSNFHRKGESLEIKK